MADMSSVWSVRRSSSDKKLAGVCGGVARHWSVDPVLVRVGFVLLALSGGVGLVLYVAGWLLIPADGKEAGLIFDLLGEQARRWPREVWIALVLIASLISFAALGAVSPFGFGPAIILGAIWYFGYYRSRARRHRAVGPPSPPPPFAPPAAPPEYYHYPGPPSAFTEAADAWRERIMSVQAPGQRRPPGQNAGTPTPSSSAATGGSSPTAAVFPVTGPTADDLQAADRTAFLAHPDPVGLYAAEPVTLPVRPTPWSTPSARRLRLAGLVVLGLALTGLGVADWLGLHIPLAAYLASALLVVGLTLIAATWWGRARGILPFGIVLAVATVAVSLVAAIVPTHALTATPSPDGWGSQPTPTRKLVAAPSSDGWGSQRVTYTTVSELSAGDRRDLGRINVDLSRLRLTEDAAYQAHVGVGSLTVRVPPADNVVVRYSVQAGAVTVYGQKLRSGSDLTGTVPADSTSPGAPTLTLDLSADVGQVEVVR
jgi:phage shock protein PspC (stress-responsive transcriptional regulator)